MKKELENILKELSDEGNLPKVLNNVVLFEKIISIIDNYCKDFKTKGHDFTDHIITQIENLKTKINEQTEHNKTIEKKIVTLNQKKEELEEANSGLYRKKEELESIQLRFNQLNEEIESLSKANQISTQDLDKLEKVKNEGLTEKQTLDKGLVTIRSNIDNLNSLISKQREEIREGLIEFQKLGNIFLSKLKDDLQDMVQTNNNLENEIKSKKEELTLKIDECNKLANRFKDLIKEQENIEQIIGDNQKMFKLHFKENASFIDQFLYEDVGLKDYLNSLAGEIEKKLEDMDSVLRKMVTNQDKLSIEKIRQYQKEESANAN